MIHYSLRCTADHRFDSWFPSAAAYDDQAGRGLVRCPDCGTARVEKAPMAPALRSGPAAEAGRPAAPAEALARRMAALRHLIETRADYVGPDFAAEARRIHSGDAPERAIYGEAGPGEARALIEEGVPVAPLPFVPSRKVN